MGISPIASIRAISLLKPSNEENSQPAAVSFEPAGQVGDDTYDSSSDASDHNMTEEQPNPEEGSQAGERVGEDENPVPGEGESWVNIFA